MTHKLSGRTRVLSVSLVLLVAISAITLIAYASTYCQFKENGCKVTVQLSEYTGPPPYPICLIGHPLVEVTVGGICKGNGTGSDSQIVCGALADAVVLTVGSKTITVEPIAGHKWEDALGNCEKFIDVTVN